LLIAPTFSLDENLLDASIIGLGVDTAGEATLALADGIKIRIIVTDHIRTSCQANIVTIGPLPRID
jgi:hypothetical protein